MLRSVAQCAILVCLAVVGAASAARAADSCNLSGGFDHVTPEDDVERRFIISSGKGVQCAPIGVIEISAGCWMSENPHHGYASFECRSRTDTAAHPRLSGTWAIRSREAYDGPAVFEGVGGLSTKHLPKHRPARETWLGPIDVEGWYVYDGVPPYGYGTNEYWRAKGRNYIDYYPQTFTKIGTVVRWAHPTFRLSTQALYYTTMNGKERAAMTGEAALDCLRIHFVSWTDPKDAEETGRHLTSFLEGLRLEPAQLTMKQRKWLCEGP
jgi:hypothetical protein